MVYAKIRKHNFVNTKKILWGHEMVEAMKKGHQVFLTRTSQIFFARDLISQL
jgi:hypothetical protein